MDVYLYIYLEVDAHTSVYYNKTHINVFATILASAGLLIQ